MSEAKPGWKTTEFWLAMVLEAVAAAAALKGQPSLPGVASAAYSLSRGLAKGGLIRGWLGKELLKDPAAAGLSSTEAAP